MKNKVGKTLVFTLASAFAFIPASNAVNLTMDELADEILAKNPDCAYINVIGGHVYTQAYENLSFEDLLLGSRSIKTEITNEDIKNKKALEKMATWNYNAKVDDDFNFIGFEYSNNMTGTDKPAADQVYEINYIDNEYVGDKAKVTFVINGVKETVLMSKGEKVTKPADPKVDGYLFKGWRVNDVKGEVFDFEDDTITEDLVLVAELKNQTATVEDEIELNLALADSEITKIVLGKSFTVDSSVIVSKDITIDGANNTISFKTTPKYVSNGSNYVFKVYGSDAENKINVTLSNMNVSNSLGAIIAGNNAVVTVDNVDVSGNVWGGIEVVDTLVVKSIKMTDEYLGHPVAWYDNTDEKETITFEGDLANNVYRNVEGTQTKYYLSEENAQAEKYVVSFDNGENIEYVTYEKNATVEKPENPTREGYVFIEWRLKGETTAFDFENTKVEGKIELVAEWKNTTQEVTDEAELRLALEDKDVVKIVLANTFTVDSSVVVSRDVIIDGSANTISFKEMPTYSSNGDNYVFKVYGANPEEKINVSLSNMKVSNSLGAIIAGDNAVVTVDNVDVSDNAWGGIEVKDTLVVKSITMTDENYTHPTVWVDTDKVETANITFAGSYKVNVAGQDQYYLVEANSKAYQVSSADDLAAALANEKVTNIALNADIEATLNTGRNVNIDLNNNTLTGRVWIKAGANVNISNGTVTAENDAVTATGKDTVLTLTDVKVNSNTQGLISQNEGKLVLNNVTANTKTTSIVVTDGGNVVVESGTYTSEGNVIATNGKAEYAGSNIVVNGGKFVSTFEGTDGAIATAVYVANKDNVVLNGGTYTVKNGVGIVARSGNTTIGENVVINAAGTGMGTVADAKNVQVPAGKAVVRDLAAKYPGGTPTVTNNSKNEVYDLYIQYTVAYDKNNGEELVNVAYNENSKIERPENPTREGYKFVEWRLKGETTAFDFENAKAEKNIELVAEWKATEVDVTAEDELKLALADEDVVKVVLKNDLTLSTDLTVARDVTLDLAGHTLNNKVTVNKGNVVVENGSIKTTGKSVVTNGEGTVLTINNVNVESGNQAVTAQGKSKVIVNSGKMVSQESTLAANTESILEINGGEFTAKDNAVIATNGLTKNSGNTITVNGGTFNGNIATNGYIAAGVYLASTDTLVLNGGTFNVENGVGVLARSGNVTVSDKVVINVTGETAGWVGDNKVQVPAGKAIVRDLASKYPGGEPTVTNNSKYDVFELNVANTKEELANLLADETVKEITLNKDLNLTENLVIARDVTLNLGGHNVNNKVVVNKGNVVVENGSIKTTGKSIVTNGEGTVLTINNVNVESGNQAITAQNKSTVIVNSGKYTSQENALAAVKASTLVINGGEFTAKDNAVIGTSGLTEDSGNTITVNGGTFNGNITTNGYIAAGVYLASTDTLVLKGGTFNVTNGVGVLARSGNVTVSDNVEFNVTGESTGKVGNNNVQVPAGKVIVRDLASKYPGGEPTVTNNSKYEVFTLGE